MRNFFAILFIIFFAVVMIMFIRSIDRYYVIEAERDKALQEIRLAPHILRCERCGYTDFEVYFDNRKCPGCAKKIKEE